MISFVPPVSGKHLQRFPRVCLGKMTSPNHNKAQGLRQGSAEAGAVAHMQEVVWPAHVCSGGVAQWPAAATTKTKHRKPAVVVQGWGGRVSEQEGRKEVWQRWIQVWITLSCRRHSLMKPRWGFSVRETFVCCDQQDAGRERRWVFGGKSCANGGYAGMLSTSFELADFCWEREDGHTCGCQIFSAVLAVSTWRQGICMLV